MVGLVGKKSSPFLIVYVVLVSLTLTEGGKCDNDNSFSCPNCGKASVNDCLECKGYFSTDLNEKMCFDRKLFSNKNERTADDHYPFLWNDVLGTILWFCVAGIATSCGVGGGGIYVPLGIILLRFSSKPASGLSQASVFGACLGGFLLNLQNKHPDTKIRDTIGTRDLKGKLIPYDEGKTKEQIQHDEEQYLQCGGKFYSRPIIDYDMALFLAPMVMAGAVLGVLIQKVMPNWLFLSLAGIILGMTSYKTSLKFFASYKVDKENREKLSLIDETRKREGAKSDSAENIEKDADMAPIEGEDGDNENNLSIEAGEEVVDNDSILAYITVPGQQMNGDPMNDDPETLSHRRKLLEADSRQYPIEKLLFLLLLWVGLALITFLKGGKGVDSVVDVTCESGWYYVLIAFQFLWTIGFAIVFGFRAVRKTVARMKVNYPFHQNDMLWDQRRVNLYGGLSFGAGIVAGLIGIGPGMVLSPLMLSMGVHPRVSSATTAAMVVLTSSSVAIMFVTSGLVPWEYAVYFFCICLSGAFIGKSYIDSYVKKTGMASILIGILAAIIGFATIGCFVIVLLNLSKNDWCFDGFKAFCDMDNDAACAAGRFLENVSEKFPVIPNSATSTTDI